MELFKEIKKIHDSMLVWIEENGEPASIMADLCELMTELQDKHILVITKHEANVLEQVLTYSNVTELTGEMYLRISKGLEASNAN